MNHIFLYPGTCLGTLLGHTDEVLDVAFDMTGQYLVSGSADTTARCYDTRTLACYSVLVDHDGEISSVCCSLNPLSATYNLQQTTILNFAAFSKITNKA